MAAKSVDWKCNLGSSELWWLVTHSRCVPENFREWAVWKQDRTFLQSGCCGMVEMSQYCAITRSLCADGKKEQKKKKNSKKLGDVFGLKRPK